MQCLSTHAPSHSQTTFTFHNHFLEPNSETGTGQKPQTYVSLYTQTHTHTHTHTHTLPCQVKSHLVFRHQLPRRHKGVSMRERERGYKTDENTFSNHFLNFHFHHCPKCMYVCTLLCTFARIIIKIVKQLNSHSLPTQLVLT